MKKYSGVIWNSLGSMTFAANSVLLSMMVTRVAGVEIGGDFGLAFTTAQIIYIIGIFGMNTFQMTDYIKEYSFSEYFRVKIMSSILMIVLGVLVSIFYINYQYRSNFILLLVLYMGIHSFGELYQSYYFQNKRLDLSGRSLCFRTLFALIGFISVLLISENVYYAIISMIIVSLISGYFFTILPKRTLPKSSKIVEKGNIKKIIYAIFPLFVSSLLMNIMFNTSKYAIDFFYDRELQGILNIIFMPIMVINLFSSFIFIPTLNQYILNLQNKAYTAFVNLLKRQMLLIVALTSVCTVIAWFVGDSVLTLLYGVDVGIYKNEISVIVFNGSLVSIAALLYNVMTILRIQRYILFTYIACAPICATISFLLAWQFEIMGAMIAFSVSHIIVVVVELILVAKKLKEEIKEVN